MGECDDKIREIKKDLEDQEARLITSQKAIERITETLYGEGAIVEWAKQHITAERERAEILLELKKRLAVKGSIGALSILVYLLYMGFKQWMNSPGG